MNKISLLYICIILLHLKVLDAGMGRQLRSVRVNETLLDVKLASHDDSNPKGHCLGPPYIYLTLHDANNIYKYSRDGCLLDTEVLEDSRVNSVHSGKLEFRTMALNSYDGQDALFIADATSESSQVMVFSSCNAEGKRSYVTTAVSTLDNKGIDHTYGLCFDRMGNMYISNQHTDNVMRFYKDSFIPMPFPPALDDDRKKYYYKGTYKQFGSVNVHPALEQGVRAIIIVRNELWIANEDLDGVVIVDLASGLSTNIVVIPKPVGLFYDPTSRLVYVSSRGKHREGSAMSIDRTTLKVVKKYKQDRMEHPTGLFVHDKILYVAEQIESAVLTFDVESTEYIGKLFKHVPGDIEHMILSPC